MLAQALQRIAVAAPRRVTARALSSVPTQTIDGEKFVNVRDTRLAYADIIVRALFVHANADPPACSCADVF